MGIVLVIGAVYYLTGYDRGLPLYEVVDERRNLHEVFRMRGLIESEFVKPGYPPGIIYVNYAAQYLAEFVTNQPAYVAACEVMRTARFMNLLVNLISPIFIALVVRKLAGNAPALIAALAWLVNVEIIERTQYVHPQTYEHLTYILALYFALLALTSLHRRGLFAVLSVIAGLVAVIFKYPAFPILGLGVGVALWQWRTQRRYWSVVLMLQVGLIAACAAWLLFGYGAMRLLSVDHVEATNATSLDSLLNLLNMDLVLFRFAMLSRQIGVPLPVLVLTVMVGGAMVWQRGETVHRLAIVALLAQILLHIVALVIYLPPFKESMRQNLPISGFAIILLVMCSAAILDWAITHTRQTRYAYYVHSVSTGIAIGIVLSWLVPQMHLSAQFVYHRSLPVTYAAFAEYAGTTLPNNPDEKLMVSDFSPFTDYWTCFRNPSILDIKQEDIAEQDITGWRDAGYHFAQVNALQLDALLQQGIDFSSEGVVEIAQFPPPGEALHWRTWLRGQDPNIRVYFLDRIHYPATTLLADGIAFAGYNLSAEQVEPGSTLTVYPFWQTYQRVDADYQVYLHLTVLDDRAVLLAQADGPPNSNDKRPTSTWHKPGESYYVGRFDLPIPEALQAGDYQLVLGLYRLDTGERLLTEAGTDYIPIPIRVARAF